MSKCKQRCGWINRAFINKSITLRRKLWRSYIEPLLDYGSQLYTPINLGLIAHLESVQRLFTVQTDNLNIYNYYDRLKLMKLSSVQRRQERYRIIYVWKILQGLVPNPGIEWDSNVSRGRIVKIPTIKSSYSIKAKNMREQSLGVHGGKLFNSLPVDIRNCTESLDVFKKILDTLLKDIPDKPVCSGVFPDLIDPSTCKNSNSIIHWVLYLKLANRRPALPGHTH